MKNLWNRLSNSGVTDHQPHKVVRKIRLQNQVSLLFISFLIFFSGVNVVNNKVPLAIIEVIFSSLIALALYLNHKKKYYLSSTMLYMVLVSLPVSLCFIYAPLRELEYMFLVVGIIPLTIYKRNSLTYSYFILNLILFIAAKIFNYGVKDTVSYLNYLFIFSMVFFIVKYLKDEFENYLNVIEVQNNKLIKLNEEKSKLISIASHDLRSPLIRIQSLLSLLSLEGSLSPEQKEILRTAQREAKNQTEMIKEALDLYAMDEGIKTVNLSPVDIPDMITRLMHDFIPVARKKNIAAILDSKTSAQFTHADPHLVRQIFENLLSNAIKFSYPNTNITIILKSSAQTMQISFKDEGQGLDAEDHKKLFKRFQRLSAQPTGGEPSSGLGLSIAKKYTEMMNGSLICVSEKGKGATFTVELPLAQNGV